jgi:hypothetical protein
LAIEFDLALAWEWPFDASFVDRLLARCASQGWRVLPITRANLESVVHDVVEGRLRLRCFLDRAADERPEFLPLTPLLESLGTQIINRVHHQTRSCDKARTHLSCAAGGVAVPFTVIAPPFAGDPSPPRLPAALGRPFVAKPAGGGGGQGVRLDIATVRDVQDARRLFWHEPYLLQQRVFPRYLEGRRAWFRVFYVCGRVIPCWWDDLSHVYAPLTADEESRFGLACLRQIIRRIGQIVALDLFTAEIAMGCDGRLVCIDYANSPCDLRLQSEHHGGVPDRVIEQIVDALLLCLELRPEELREWEAAGREVRA